MYEDVQPYSGTGGGGGGGSGADSGSCGSGGDGGGGGTEVELIGNPAYLSPAICPSKEKPPYMTASSEQLEYSYVTIPSYSVSVRVQPE